MEAMFISKDRVNILTIDYGADRKTKYTEHYCFLHFK